MRNKLQREVRVIVTDAIFNQFRRQARDRSRFSGTDRYIEEVIDARIDRAYEVLRNQTATAAANFARERQIEAIEAALSVVGPGEARIRLEGVLAELVLDAN